MTDEELRAKAHGLAVKLGVCQDPDDDGPRTVCSMNCDDIFDALREVAGAADTEGRLAGMKTGEAMLKGTRFWLEETRKQRAVALDRALAAEAKLGEAVHHLSLLHLCAPCSGGCEHWACVARRIVDARPSSPPTEPDETDSDPKFCLLCGGEKGTDARYLCWSCVRDNEHTVWGPLADAWERGHGKPPFVQEVTVSAPTEPMPEYVTCRDCGVTRKFAPTCHECGSASWREPPTEPTQCGCGWCSKCRRRYCYMEGAHVCAPPTGATARGMWRAP